MFDLGMQELIVIFIVALLVFGPKRLPELGRTLGKGILELKKALHGVKEQMDTEFDMMQQPPQPPSPPPQQQLGEYLEEPPPKFLGEIESEEPKEAGKEQPEEPAEGKHEGERKEGEGR